MASLKLTILSSGSGDLLASLVLERAQLVEEALEELTKRGSPFRAYTLLHGDRALLPRERLGEIFGEVEEVTLTAVALPMLRIPCSFDVIAASFIPKTEDLLLVTKGNILDLKDEEVPVLGDDVPNAIFWFWRLFQAEQWSFASASLLARRSICVAENALVELWEREKDSRYCPWTKEEVEEQKRSGIVKWGKNMRDSAHLYLRVHDESHAVFTWNQSDFLGGCGIMDRLDLATGQVTPLGKIWDAWDVATDPETGRLFYTSCYDGTDVHLLKDVSVSSPRPPSAAHPTQPTETFILSQTVGLGYSLCYDSSLKALVSSSSAKDFFIISPPGAHFEGEQLPSIRAALQNDYTPGDKSAPWDTVRISGAESRVASKKCGFHANEGCVTYVDSNAQEQLCKTSLLDGTTECTTFSEPIQFVACLGDFCAVFTRAHT